MRPPRLCCGIKHTKSENLPPYAPQISGFDLLSLLSPGACPPFRADTGRQHALRSGRETRMRPKRARIPKPCALKNQHRKVLLCGLGRVGRVNSSSRTFFGLLLRVRSGRPLHIYQPTRVQFNRSCTGSGEVQRRHAYDECPQKFR